MEEQVINKIHESIKNQGLNPEQVSKFIFDKNKNNPDYWNFLSKETELTPTFIIEHLDNLNIDDICCNQKHLESTVTTNDKFIAKLSVDNWNFLIQYQHLDESTIQLYIIFCKNHTPELEIDWTSISKNQHLSIDFIEKYSENLDWYWISQEQFLTFEFLIKFREKINWDVLAYNEKTQYLFTDAFIHLFEAKDIWNNIGIMDQVTLGCIEIYFDRIPNEAWYSICENKELSIDLIEKVLNKFNNNIPNKLWDSLSQNSKLSEEIIDKYKDNINWNLLSLEYNFNLDIIDKYKTQINLTELSYNDCLTLDMIKILESNQNQFQGKLDWEYISEFGNIDKEFINTSDNIIKPLALNNDNLQA